MWKKVVLSVVMAVGLLAAVQSDGASVNKIFGAAANGPAPSVPLTPAILCQAPSLCARVIAPDWSDADSNRFYGWDGANCRVSTDGAQTWANCGSNASPTTNMAQLAVTRNGTVLFGANDNGGSVFRIRRSTDGANSFSTVYDSTPVDLLNAAIGPNMRFRCARDIDLCIFLGASSVGNQKWALVSTNDGLTWVLTNPISLNANISGWFSVVMANDGSLYYAAPSGVDGFSAFRSITFDTANWVESAIWTPTAAGGVCNWSFLLAGNRRTICHDTTLGTTYTMRSEIGTIVSTFSIPDVPSDNGVSSTGLALSVTDSSIHLVRSDTTGRTGLWVSADSGNSFIKLFATDPAGQGIGNQGSVFQGVDGCVYFSYITTAFSSTVFKVCL